MRSAGCVVNDIADRNFDPHVERTKDRPLAAGRFSLAEAVPLAAVLAGARISPGAAAEHARRPALRDRARDSRSSIPFLKRFFWLPQAWLGIAFGFGIPMAFAAHHASVPPIAWWLLAANIFWAIAYDTEYAMVDRDDDRRIGLKSSAILFGNLDVAVTMLCLALFIALMAVIGVRANLGIGYFVRAGRSPPWLAVYQYR